MNILTVLLEELSAEGIFYPSDRVQKHLFETLKAQDGDILKVGVIGGQRGLGQVIIESLVDAKKGVKVPYYKVQLLPLCFSCVDDALKLSGTSVKLAAADEEVRDTAAKKPETSFRVREDRYKFATLCPDDWQLWQHHPFAPGVSVVPTPPSTISKYASAPVETLIKRSTQPRIDLFLALPRPKLLDKLLQYIASMSIGRVHFFASARSDLAYFSSPKVKAEVMKQQLRIGLEQGMRTTPGPIFVSGSVREALKQAKEFYEASDDEFRTLVAHPYAVGIPSEGRAADKSDLVQPSIEGNVPIHMMNTNLVGYSGNVILVLGPEGGFVETEVQQIMSALPTPQLVSLGEDILRCEVALLSLIGQTQMLLTAEGNRGTRKYSPLLNEYAVRISPPGRKKAKLMETDSAHTQDDQACSQS